jgi:hypothetical protein
MKSKIYHLRKPSRATVRQAIEESVSMGAIKRYKGFGIEFKDILDTPSLTICVLTTDEGKEVKGYAFCGKRDIFCKKKGRSLAEDRAKDAANKVCKDMLPGLTI